MHFLHFLTVFGCILGTLLAHAMFDQAFLQIASTERAGYHFLLSEWIATFALVFAIFGAVRYAPKSVPAASGLNYSGWVLVDILYELCKSGDNNRTGLNKYFYWNKS